MAKNQGFTLIELIIFVIVLGTAVGTIVTATVLGIRGIPQQHQQTISTAISAECMEYLLGQRYLKGFNFNNRPGINVDCPGAPDYTQTPAFCSNNTSNGFTTSVSIKCTSINGDLKYKEIEVKTTGDGTTIFKQLIADY